MIFDAMLVESARGDEQRLRLIRALDLALYMCVPLIAKGRVAGAISFVSAKSNRHFTDQELTFAEQVAARAGLAIEHAQAYADARDANRLKDEFLATLSHELRTPLNTLLGYARMLNEGVIGADKQRRAIHIIERNATALSQIVADVLDVSRIISGKLRLEMQPVDVPSILREAIETVRPAADAKNIAIALSVESVDSIVQADASRLQQVAWNLLSNATKFTPVGGRIDIRVLQQAATVDIEVADNGIGIPADFLPYVFDRFRQADSRFAREHGGLGLGLAIARHIVEMHGGEISVASDGPGTGTTFRVTLPVAEMRETEAPETKSASVSTSRRQLAGVRVLAVDDQEDALALLRDALESAGADVMTAVDGQQAIALIERERPDVLVSDIGMPGMDGFELIRRVRRSTDVLTKRLPAAAITAVRTPRRPRGGARERLPGARPQAGRPRGSRAHCRLARSPDTTRDDRLATRDYRLPTTRLPTDTSLIIVMPPIFLVGDDRVLASSNLRFARRLGCRARSFFRADREGREQLVEIDGVAFRAARRVGWADERLEFVSARAADEVVERHAAYCILRVLLF